ncbi:hypothetical protein [Acetivibrio mesophilus]|uniref:hypothetical protein n=1 Tax=Acetivibrio mesophilus TaxID=2487273 RepID=UPI000AC3B569|nr:hypothetical protein [Acetivibrio mesophilus]
MWGEFDFWRILVEYFLEEADCIRIDCWNEEESIIDEISPLSNGIDKESNERMTIFTFLVNEKNVEHIIYNAFDEKRRLKWFSLFLQRDGEIFFSSEHYGKEFSITGITKDELKWVKGVVPRNFIFHTY